LVFVGTWPTLKADYQDLHASLSVRHGRDAATRWPGEEEDALPHAAYPPDVMTLNPGGPPTLEEYISWAI
jgi:hypothetical protein